MFNLVLIESGDMCMCFLQEPIIIKQKVVELTGPQAGGCCQCLGRCLEDGWFIISPQLLLPIPRHFLMWKAVASTVVLCYPGSGHPCGPFLNRPPDITLLYQCGQEEGDLAQFWATKLCVWWWDFTFWRAEDSKLVDETSFVVQWLRICLLMQGTWVWSLVRELRSHIPQSTTTREKPSQQRSHVPQLRPNGAKKKKKN